MAVVVQAEAEGSTVDAVSDEGAKEAESSASSGVAASTLPLNEDGSLDFFWLDACEVEGRKGTIFLFGKVACDTKSIANTPGYAP